jgi:ZIP family zinc transporter
LTLIKWFVGLHPLSQSLVATLFTWLMTTVGAAMVFFAKDLNQKFFDAMLGFAGGIMIAVSYFSLLAPAVDMAIGAKLPSWVPVTAGFLLGGFFLWLVDKILPHINPSCPPERSEGIKTSWQRNTLLVMAITLHNIPEGLAVGVAFGAVAAGFVKANLTSAVLLTFGLGLQNLPEGFAVSLPLRFSGITRKKSFFYGQLSGIVEPMAAVLGALIVSSIRSMLPYALGFAAGAMFYVVIEEIIPGAQRCENSDLATIGAMLGFAVMMVMEVAFG